MRQASNKPAPFPVDQEEGPQDASFGHRCVAAVFDVIACGFVTGVWTILVILAFRNDIPPEVLELLKGKQGSSDENALLTILPFQVRMIFAICMIAPCLYYFTEAMMGWSIGKMMTGLRLRNADTSYLDVGPGAIRWAIKCSPSVMAAFATAIASPALFAVVGIVKIILFLGCFMAIKPGSSALHDQLSGTGVFPNTVPYKKRSTSGRTLESGGQSKNQAFETW